MYVTTIIIKHPSFHLTDGCNYVCLPLSVTALPSNYLEYQLISTAKKDAMQTPWIDVFN
jgi:hypothetical protein